MRNWYIEIGALSLALSVLVWTAANAQDHSGHHGDGHAEMHEWYKTLGTPGAGGTFGPPGGCCNARVVDEKTGEITGDCRPVDANINPEKKPGNDGYWVATVDGQKVPIPDSAILKGKTAPDYGAHVCMPDGGFETPPYVRCFIEPKMFMLKFDLNKMWAWQ